MVAFTLGPELLSSGWMVVRAEARAAQIWKCAKCGKARVPYLEAVCSKAAVPETIAGHSENMLCYTKVRVNVSDVIY